MNKIIAVAAATTIAVGGVQSAYAEFDDHDVSGIFIYAGMDMYSKNHIKLNIADAISVSDSIKGDFGDYNIGIGYMAGVFSMSANFAGMDIDDVRMQRMTARLEMRLVPFYFAPFVFGDIGLAHIGYDDEYMDISKHGFTYGTGFGLRAGISDELTIKATMSYSWARFNLDVIEDIDIKLNGRRTSIEIGLEYLF